MKAETKTATLRLPVAMVDELTANGAMLNPALVDFYNRARAEQRLKALDIKGVLTPQEWKALALAFVGTEIDDRNREQFAAFCQYLEDEDGTFSANGVPVQAIADKINRLTRIQAASVLDRLDEWLHNRETIDFDRWVIY